MYGRYALFQIEQLRERLRIANNLPGVPKPVVATIKTDDARLIAPIYAK